MSAFGVDADVSAVDSVWSETSIEFMIKLFVPALSLLLLGACGEVCVNQTVMRQQSPDAKLDAILFQRDCGATTGFSTQISIVAKGRDELGPGNVFIADADHGNAKIGEWGGPWATMNWNSNTDLRVQYAVGSRVFVQEQEIRGVRIVYETVAD